MKKIGTVLLAFAIAAVALTVLASAAMAEGQIRDVNAPNATIAKGRVLHLVGWTSFTDEKEAKNGFECHVTSTIETDVEGGTTGTMTAFTPDTAHCFGLGLYKGCKIIKDENTNMPWHVKTTLEDFDITGIDFRTTVTECPLEVPFGRAEEVTGEIGEITARPLKTGTEVNTNTSNTLGATAKAGEPIAGIEFFLSGTGVHVKYTSGFTRGLPTVDGKLELTSPDRCTWKISAT